MTTTQGNRRKLAGVILWLIGLVSPLVYVAQLLVTGASQSYSAFVFRNYLIFFGMPYAAIFAYFLVSTLEKTRGPIEVELATFKFKGAGGPLLFWILVFLTIISGFQMLWRG